MGTDRRSSGPGFVPQLGLCFQLCKGDDCLDPSPLLCSLAQSIWIWKQAWCQTRARGGICYPSGFQSPEHTGLRSHFTLRSQTGGSQISNLWCPKRLVVLDPIKLGVFHALVRRAVQPFRFWVVSKGIMGMLGTIFGCLWSVIGSQNHRMV